MRMNIQYNVHRYTDVQELLLFIALISIEKMHNFGGGYQFVVELACLVLDAHWVGMVQYMQLC